MSFQWMYPAANSHTDTQSQTVFGAQEISGNRRKAYDLLSDCHFTKRTKVSNNQDLSAESEPPTNEHTWAAPTSPQIYVAVLQYGLHVGP